MLNNYFQDDDGDWVNIGLSTSETNFGPLIGFQGTQDSHQSFLGYLPQQGLSIVVLSNNSDSFEILLEAFQNFLQSNVNETLKDSCGRRSLRN